MIVQIFVIYILTVFVLTRLLVPYLGFIKSPILSIIPAELQQKINELSAGKNQEEFLRAVYEFVTARYQGRRMKTIMQFWRAFQDPWKAIPGFAPCNISNQLLRTMLVASGKFKDENIDVRYTFLNFFIHQYLKVHVAGRSIDVDCWGKTLGIQFGQHASLFI